MPVINPTFKPARGLIRKVLDRGGLAAIVLPTRMVHICEEYLHDNSIRRHECAHLAQWDRDGTVKFWVQIVGDFLFRGYRNSRYEIEARQAEHDPNHPLLANYNWRAL